MERKTAEKIVQETLKNGGYTHNKNGGRYVVAIEGNTVKISADRFNFENVLSYVKVFNNFDLGTWVENGIVYLDTVETYNNFETAKKLGLERGEIAIFDLETMEEIRL